MVGSSCRMADHIRVLANFHHDDIELRSLMALITVSAMPAADISGQVIVTSKSDDSVNDSRSRH